MGLLTVINKIQDISQIHGVAAPPRASSLHLLPSQKVHPEENEDLEHCEEQKFSWLSLLVRRLNLAGFLTEIALILQKLTWLEGKVRIVHAFIPIVAKLVCQKGISEAKILESKLIRRYGCYMFVDIQGFFSQFQVNNKNQILLLCAKVFHQILLLLFLKCFTILLKQPQEQHKEICL